MVACVIGTVIAIENRRIVIEDRLTKQHYTCETEGDDFLNLVEGDQGVFVGQYYNDTFRVKRIEVRKFLDPLYEVDLFDAAGKYSMVPVMNDPFTEVYLEFLERQKEDDARKSADISTGMP